MKNMLLLALLTSLVALPLQGQTSRASETPPLVSVSGNAEIKVIPDLIEIKMGIELRDPSLEKALALHKEKINAVIEALKKQGVPAKDIQTDYIGMSPYYAGGESVQATNFFIQKSIVCTIRDASIFENVMKSAIAAGVTHIHGIDFRTSELRKYRDQARLNAIKAAREKADLLTHALGAKTGKPFSISESFWGGYWTWRWSSWGWGYYSYNNALSQNVSQSIARDNPMDTAGGNIALGQISISATVNVSFLIE